MNLKDKVVLVTGSSSGIGKTTAIRFAKEGAKVVVNYKTNKNGAEETALEIKKLGKEVRIVQADVANEKEIERLFKTVVDTFGTVDILINNAGNPTEKIPFMEAKYTDIAAMIDTNLIGPYAWFSTCGKNYEKAGVWKDYQYEFYKRRRIWGRQFCRVRCYKSSAE